MLVKKGKTVGHFFVLILGAHLVSACTQTLSALQPGPKVATPTANPSTSRAAANKPLAFDGEITGTEVSDIVFNAKQGQRIQVNLKSTSSFVYFNVLPPGDGKTLFVGQSDAEPNEWVGQAGVSGNYIIRLYQLGGRKTRGKKATYSVTLQVS